MRDPFLRSFASLSSSNESWLFRVRENLRQLFAAAPLFPNSANGAPIGILKIHRTATEGRAQTASTLMHGALILGLALLSVHSPRQKGGPLKGGDSLPRPLVYYHSPAASAFGRPSLGKSSGGGEEDPRPARHGLLAPGSLLPLAPPRLVVNPHPELPVPVAVFDSNAPQFPPQVNNLGLPWRRDDSDSAGPGKAHGIGAGRKGGMGDDLGPWAGQGTRDGGPYANLVTSPKCAYCPDPQYTDEAREAKVQGSVTLLVLVDAEGRASEIRVAKGIGLGLDERAMQAIREWRFTPARDAADRPVPAWVMVEATFRLF
jgi:periplasmic protein TonB